MIVTFLRSSSIGTYANCPHSYLLNYVMGLPSLSGKPAAKGNVVHKAMETLAWKSVGVRDGVERYEDETFGLLNVADITADSAVEASYAYYKSIEPDLKWDDHVDLQDCRDWTRKFLTINDGYFDPANMDVVSPEVKFEMTIDEPWARYEYVVGGERIAGQLGIKGTVDLVVRDGTDPNILEFVDYKTGRQSDFATGEDKDYDSLSHDKQLLLYYYALSRKYPDKQLVGTIIFINYDGPFRLTFGPEHVVEAEAMLRREFEKIRGDKSPALITNPKHSWKCKYVCSYGKPSPWDESRTTCRFLRDSVVEIGMDATVEKFGVSGAFTRYGSGGGRQAEAPTPA